MMRRKGVAAMDADGESEAVLASTAEQPTAAIRRACRRRVPSLGAQPVYAWVGLTLWALANARG